MSDPGYYFLPGDYARDTAHLTNDEDLAYRRLLDAYYSRCGAFPPAIGWLQRVSRVSLEAVQAVADEFFPINGDGLRHNKRADAQIKKRLDYMTAQSARGKASWEARKGRGQTTAIASVQTAVRDLTNGGSFPVQTGDEPPLPLPLPKKKTTLVRKAPAYSHEYEELWKIHNYGSKSKGWDEYQRMDSPPEHREMVLILKSQVAMELAARGTPARLATLPHMERWLKNRMWENGITKQEAAPYVPKLSL